MGGYTGYGDLTDPQRNELERLDRIAEQSRVHAFNEVSKWTGVDLSAPGTLTQGGGAASGANVVNEVDFEAPTPPATPPQNTTLTSAPEWQGNPFDLGYTWDPVKGAYVGYGLKDLALGVGSFLSQPASQWGGQPTPNSALSSHRPTATYGQSWGR